MAVDRQSNNTKTYKYTDRFLTKLTDGQTAGFLTKTDSWTNTH